MQTLKLFTKDETGALTFLDLNLPILRMTLTQARGAKPVLRLMIRWNDRRFWLACAIRFLFFR
ncbi:MAG: hypothetical protein C0582_00030 [Alphaproteobacteria bacterium]|nr:MAG: hypothetical protein C0582_00030 [Alphaproteobacteria bacterium]